MLFPTYVWYMGNQAVVDTINSAFFSSVDDHMCQWLPVSFASHTAFLPELDAE